MKVKIKKLNESAVIPKYSKAGDAGMDLVATSKETDKYGNIVYGTGLAFELPEGFFAGIFARSGLATKQGLRPANCVGICDWDYRGEYIVALHNDSEEEKEIRNGDRIAQLVFLPYITGEIKVVDELSNTERGDGGFGSTGK